jgi:hypothetical protein
MLRVTQLEPRTLHQPEKLKKLSKNDPVVLLLVLESMKSVCFYLIYFQWSAGRPQACDRILCNGAKPFRAEGRRGKGFRDARPEWQVDVGAGSRFVIVKIRRRACWARNLSDVVF